MTDVEWPSFHKFQSSWHFFDTTVFWRTADRCYCCERLSAEWLGTVPAEESRNLLKWNFRKVDSSNLSTVSSPSFPRKCVWCRCKCVLPPFLVRPVVARRSAVRLFPLLEILKQGSGKMCDLTSKLMHDFFLKKKQEHKSFSAWNWTHFLEK